MSEGTLDDAEINPYAVFNSVKRPVDAAKNNQARDSKGSGELQPYATSTPNALFLSLQQGGGVPGATPPSDSVWQKRESKTEDLYAQVDLSRKRSFRKSKDLTMNDSEVNLIENTLYANNNLVQSQKSARETPPTTREASPPLPKRNYDLSEDFPAADSRTDTLRSVDDEGYNTFKNDDRKEENPYAAVADVQPRPPSIAVEDPYFLRVKEKIDFFNNKVVLPRQDVWVKMDARQGEVRSSVPDLHRKGSDMGAPLAQQEVKTYCATKPLRSLICLCWLKRAAFTWCMPRSLTLFFRCANWNRIQRIKKIKTTAAKSPKWNNRCVVGGWGVVYCYINVRSKLEENTAYTLGKPALFE